MKQKLSLLTMALSLALVLALGVGIALAQDVTVTLNPSPGQTASGTATLTAVSPTTTRVDVTVSGLTPNTSIANHIHGGTCASPGGTPHFFLPNLVANAQGNASTTTTLNASLSDLAGLIIIAPHVEAGGTPTICGTIPTVAAAPAATPAAVATPAAAPAPVVAGVAALPAAGGLPVPLVPTALLSVLAMGIGIYLRRR